MTTGVVSIDSKLVRNSWMRQGMIQKASQSFWTPYTGTSKDSIVYNVNNENSKEGHTVVFDYDGNLSGKAIKGKTRAYGKGEQKRKFSDKVTVERYRLPVDNGDTFDGVNIGDLSINQHQDSRSKLGDLWIRWKDQGLFDASQGNLYTNSDGAQQAATHVIDTVATLDYNTLVDIETTLRTSQGYTTGGIRRPLSPYTGTLSQPMWIFMMDANQAALLRKDTAGYQNILRSADVRGDSNRLIKGYIGHIGALAIVEAPNFFGDTLPSTASGWGLDDTEVEMCGLRQFDTINNVWTGEEGFDYASTLQSSGLILGAGALQLAMGKQPDYRWQESEDFSITSESALEVWTEMRKCKYQIESGKNYKAAKVDNIDHGVVSVTTITHTVAT